MNINSRNLNLLNGYTKESIRVRNLSGESKEYSIGENLLKKNDCTLDTKVKYNFGNKAEDDITMQRVADILEGARRGDPPTEAMKEHITNAIHKRREEQGLPAEKNYVKTKEEIQIIETIENMALEKANDKDSTLNHSFATYGSELSKLFDSVAKGYAQDFKNGTNLNDKDVLSGKSTNKEDIHKALKKEIKKEAVNILSYFRFGEQSEKEVDALTDQLEMAMFEHGKLIASGEEDNRLISTQLDINGVSMSYKDLLDAQKILADQNEKGLTNCFGGGQYRYALGSTYDVVGFEQLGVMVAQVEKGSQKLPEKIADMLFGTFKKRVDNTIEESHGERQIKELKQAGMKAAKILASKIGNYSIMVDNMGLIERATKELNDPNALSFYRFKGSIFESAYQAAYKNEMAR